MESQVSFSQGMKIREMWEEVLRRFDKENSAINATDFYAGDSFGLFIDLRSLSDYDLHVSGLRLMNRKEEVHLAIKRKPSSSRKLNLTSSSSQMLSLTSTASLRE